MARLPGCDVTDLERRLVGNALDGLDRLYDRRFQQGPWLDQWGVASCHDLLVATAAALPDSDLHELLKSSADSLLAILRSNETLEAQYDAALAATDELRRALAAVE